jgi:hypothetical protein
LVLLMDDDTIRGWHKLFEQRGIEGLTSFDMGGSAESPDAEWLRRLASARGFGRAHALFPDTVAAAYARGSQAMSTLPTTFLALTEPAVTFDPAAFDSAAFTVPE